MAKRNNRRATKRKEKTQSAEITAKTSRGRTAHIDDLLNYCKETDQRRAKVGRGISQPQTDQGEFEAGQNCTESKGAKKKQTKRRGKERGKTTMTNCSASRSGQSRMSDLETKRVTSHRTYGRLDWSRSTRSLLFGGELLGSLFSGFSMCFMFIRHGELEGAHKASRITGQSGAVTEEVS